MSDTMDAAVAEELVERLTQDAVRCSGADECVMPLMYCSFGPADRCDEIAALWLHVLAERDALLAAIASDDMDAGHKLIGNPYPEPFDEGGQR